MPAARPACVCCRKRMPRRGRRRCPLCGFVFRGGGWNGIDAHWRSRHERQLPYARFWGGLCVAHRRSEPLGCPSCAKGIPVPWICQCPECAQVFAGRGWEGIDAHWRARHAELMSYEDFWQSLCPGHRGQGDGASGFLPLGRD